MDVSLSSPSSLLTSYLQLTPPGVVELGRERRETERKEKGVCEGKDVKLN